MPYDPVRDPFVGSGEYDGPASDWVDLTAAMIGTSELPTYGRAILVVMSPTNAAELRLDVIPLRGDDTTIRTQRFYGTEMRPIRVRRIAAVNGGTVIPPGMFIHIITR